MIRVAAAQIKVTKDVHKNLQKILDCIKKAAKRKSNIICFPEASLVNGSNKKTLNNTNFRYLLKKIKNTCKENDIYCIFTTYYLEEKKMLNRAFLIDNKGKTLYTYDKINLWKTERKNGVDTGSKNHLIKTKLCKITIITCWDIAYPEYIKRIAKDADILFCPSYVFDYGRQEQTYNALALARSFENSCYVIYVDAFSKDTMQYSYICSPDGIISQIKNREGIIYADLDLKQIEKIKKYYDSFRLQ